MSDALTSRLLNGDDYAFPFPLSLASLKCLRLFVYGINAVNLDEDCVTEMVKLAGYLNMNNFSAYVKCLVTGILATKGLEKKKMVEMNASGQEMVPL